LNWLIIRTDFRKEHYVASQIRLLGFDAWVPCQIIFTRPAIARRVTAKAEVSIKELPILPRRLFAHFPPWMEPQGELAHIRHLIGVERDACSEVIAIPDAEITRFRAAIDAENTASLALAQAKSRKQKAKWRSLRDALIDLVEGAKQQMEQAA
jgi:hypothetical protein